MSQTEQHNHNDFMIREHKNTIVLQVETFNISHISILPHHFTTALPSIVTFILFTFYILLFDYSASFLFFSNLVLPHNFFYSYIFILIHCCLNIIFTFHKFCYNFGRLNFLKERQWFRKLHKFYKKCIDFLCKN